MVDRVKPLKIESATIGTESDPFPTEVDELEDYLTAKGYSFEGLDSHLIDRVGNDMRFKDVTNGTYTLLQLRSGLYNVFDPTGTTLTSTNVEAAIKELTNLVAVSASPGFTWGQGGNIPAGTWLSNDSVPSNKTGRLNFLANAEIVKVFVSNELVSTFDIEIYEHDGTTFTLKSTVSVVSQRSKTFTPSGVTLTTGKEIGLKLSSGSAKNPVVGLIIKGTL